jgi:hypothetical protein
VTTLVYGTIAGNTAGTGANIFAGDLTSFGSVVARPLGGVPTVPLVRAPPRTATTWRTTPGRRAVSPPRRTWSRGRLLTSVRSAPMAGRLRPWRRAGQPAHQLHPQRVV